jgi:hypothetical protein
VWGKVLPNVNAIENLEDRLQKYKETGNTEFLVDVANMAMIEFMFPQHKCPVFETEHGTRLKGVTITDLKNFGR